LAGLQLLGSLRRQNVVRQRYRGVVLQPQTRFSPSKIPPCVSERHG
jgi:hypothetical protein